MSGGATTSSAESGKVGLMISLAVALKSRGGKGDNMFMARRQIGDDVVIAGRQRPGQRQEVERIQHQRSQEQ